MRLSFCRKIEIAAGATILLLGVFLLWNGAVNAQQSSGPSISIAPHTFDLSAEAGDEIRQKIKVYNRSDTAIPLKIKAAGFGAKEETGEMTEDDSQDLTGWFEFEKQNFIVDPGKTENINFTVKIPADAEPRGYYAVVFLEADISTYLYNESKLQVIPGLGIPFMLKVGEEQIAKPLTILEYSISDENRLEKTEKALNFLTRPFIGEQNEIAVVKSGEPSFMVRLKNNSRYHTKLSGKIKLSGLGWKLKNELEFPPITILPGKTRKVIIEDQLGENKKSALVISTAMAARLDPARLAAEDGKKTDAKTGFGLMKAGLEIEAEGGIKKETNRWILVFSWRAALLLLMVAAAVVAIAVFLIKRKRLNKKLNEDLYAEKVKLEKTANEETSPKKKQPKEKRIVKKSERNRRKK